MSGAWQIVAADDFCAFFQHDHSTLKQKNTRVARAARVFLGER